MVEPEIRGWFEWLCAATSATLLGGGTLVLAAEFARIAWR